MLQELIASGKTNFGEVESAMYNMKKRITELEKENAELKRTVTNAWLSLSFKPPSEITGFIGGGWHTLTHMTGL